MSRTLLENDVTLCREDGSSVKYHILSHIGSGASCVVYHAICEDKTEHLLKEYYPHDLDIERNVEGDLIIPEHEKNRFEVGLIRFQNGNERQKTVRLSVQLKNFTSNVQGYFCGHNTEYIDMDVFSGRTYSNVESESLYNLLRRMKVLAQVLGNYHRQGLLHLDIKPENIFVRPEGETVEDLMLFDFDSVVEKCSVMTMPTLSYTKEWGAPELLAFRCKEICEATDIFVIGEIIFTKIFGRHSTLAERRSFAKYEIDHNVEIFKNVNPKVFPLLKTLLSHTICGVVQKRYQTADELITALDELIVLANPKEHFLASNLPTPKNFFIGRDKEIEDIHRKLQENHILFLHGIGGIGKSELAKQYAKKYADEYDTVIFAPYVTDIVSLFANDNYIQIANFSRFKDEKAEEYHERKLRKIKELISDDGERILLIVDNLDTTEDQNIKLLFELGCRVLITSRVDMGTIFNRPQLEINAISDLLFARELFAHYYHFADAESDDVDAIIKLVQGHTLAIELIAKQIDSEWSTAQKIRRKLENGGLSSIGDEVIDNAKDDLATQDSALGHIKALFDLSIFEKSGKDHELYVLANLSLIPFTGIDRRLFADWCDLDNHGGKSCVNNLVKSGWIQRDGDLIALHPLVSEITISHYTNSDFSICEYMLREIAVFISTYENQIFIDDNGEFGLTPILNGIVDNLIRFSICSFTSAIILNNLARIYDNGYGWSRGYWKRDITFKCYKQALFINEMLFGEENQYTATTLNNLGSFYKNDGESDLAKHYLELALNLRKRLLGVAHDDVGETLYN